MALKEKQVMILAGGGIIAYFLLQKPKAGAQPNALQKALGIGATPLTPAQKAAQAASYAGSGQAGGGAQRPTTTNLATNYGQAKLPGTPSLQGFGANPIASLLGGFANLAGSILKGVTGATKAGGGVATTTAPKPASSSGGGGSPSGGGASSGGGPARPGTNPVAGAPNIFGGQTTIGPSVYNPADYVGINPNTGLYDPAYDPSTIGGAGYFDVDGNWVVNGDAPNVVDYSQLPGYGTPLDENGFPSESAPALGADAGTEQYQSTGANVSGPDDSGMYYYPDGSIAWGYGEAGAEPAMGDSWDSMPGYGTPLPDAPSWDDGGFFVGNSSVSSDPTQETNTDDYDLSQLPVYGSDPALYGAATDFETNQSPDDVSWWDEGFG